MDNSNLLRSCDETFISFNNDDVSNKINFVRIGVDIDRLGDIDTMNESFKAVFTITALWEENKKIEKYNEERDWNPSLYVENILNLSDNQCHYEVSYNELTKKSQVKMIQKIKGVFSY
jgi:hypothetical protein